MDASGLSPETLDPQTTEYTEVLLQCLQTRLELIKSLRTLSDSQSQAALHADVGVTLGILSRKQSLLADLSALQERMQPYYADDPETRVWSSPERRAYGQRISDEGSQLLQQAMQLEQAALDSMSNQRDAVAAQLQNGKDSILARTAYTADHLLSQSALDVSDL
jgi:hypothetical protein